LFGIEATRSKGAARGTFSGVLIPRKRALVLLALPRRAAWMFLGLRTGFVLLSVAWNPFTSAMTPVEIQSTLTCPHCNHRASETMPTDAC
jgi:hypothetical protein